MARGAAVAATLATATGSLPARGVAATAAQVFSPGGVAWDDEGTIVFVGAADDLPEEPVTLGRIDEGTIVPGFVDCHVHLPFVGWRADEYEARLAGESYRDLHGREGGIFRSARMLAEAEDDEVLAFSMALLRRDGLPRDDRHGAEDRVRAERRGRAPAAPARAAARRRGPQTCSVTLLACHAIPEGRSRGGLGGGRVRRADPGCRGGLARGRGRHLRRGHRVLARGPRAGGGGGLGRRAAAPGARGPARAERGGRGRRRPGGAERRPPEPRERRGRRGARHLGHRRGPPPRLDLHAPGGAGARRCAPGRRRRPRDRHRPQPRDVADLLDARDDRDRVLALRDVADRGARRRDREPRVGPRPRRPARHARGRQARRPRAPRRPDVRPRPVPTGTRPGRRRP